MGVIILPSAQKDIQQICQYLRAKTFSSRSGQKLRNGIKLAIDMLSRFPKSGMKEPMLEDKGSFRYMVVQKHYKVIYMVEDNLCYVFAVWDCRNNPMLLKERFENG